MASFHRKERGAPAMASSRLELNQSSLDSFFRKTPPQVSLTSNGAGSVSPSYVLEPGDADAAAEYERARLENIRRNRDFLLNLGISSGVRSPKSDLRPQGNRNRRASPAISLPLRRSARKRPFSSSSTEAKVEETAESIEIPPPTYVDSSVLQYTCSERSSLLSSSFSSSSSPVSVFRIRGKTLQTRSLPKIYTMDARSVNDDKVLVAAGGHGGIISIFGVDEGEDDPQDANEREIQAPLLNWKASMSWISGVFFLEDNPMLLLSSSNDGRVMIWDVSKQPSLEHSSTWSPPAVAESTELHSGGIFSMHHLHHSIVTSSKDSSIVISILGEDGKMTAERTISGHHSGAIKGVRFRETKHIIADCGADRCICILDGRLSEPCTLTLESNHQTHVNSIEWSPSDRNLLLSASKDPVLYLHDIRNPREPVYELQGHVQSSRGICNRIYKPAFARNRSMVVTPGEGSRKISMYCMDDGKLVSQGMMGYDPSLVFFNGEGHMWVAGKQINQLSGVSCSGP